MPDKSSTDTASLPTLRRTLDQYAKCTSNAVCGGSRAQMHYFVDDAKHDIAALASALAAERERCTKIAESWFGNTIGRISLGPSTQDAIAAAIRTLGDA